MKYAYAGIFFEDEGVWYVSVPDLPAVFTDGPSLAECIEMGQDAAAMWLWDAERKGEAIPCASVLGSIQARCEPGQFASYVYADTDEYRKTVDTKSVKKTLTIPSWLNYQAEKANAPFSQLLQEALKKHLGID